MALPVIIFNAATGSDTAASGAGPSTALTGAGASINGTTSIDLSADSPNLSGVVTDGSAVLWVNTSSGRKFFKITNTNNTTKIVTVANAATGTESGRTWAIGGKRATIDAATSRVLFSADALPGWTISLEDAQSISSALAPAVSGDTTNGHIILTGPSGRVTITQTASAAHFSISTANYWTVRRLNFVNTNATKTSADVLSVSGNSDPWLIEDCCFGDATNKVRSAMTRSGGLQDNWIWRNCEFKYCTSNAFNPANSGGGNWLIQHCYSHHNTGAGLGLTMGAVTVEDSVIVLNGGDGISSGRGSARVRIERCVIDENTGDGIDISAGGVQLYVMIRNNQITKNGGAGVLAASGQSAVSNAYSDFNNFGTGSNANTSGNYVNMTAGSNDLSVDPGYTNRAGGDYSGGTNVKAKGSPLVTAAIGLNSATYAYMDIGIQRQEAGGGGPRRTDWQGGFGG